MNCLNHNIVYIFRRRNHNDLQKAAHLADASRLAFDCPEVNLWIG